MKQTTAPAMAPERLTPRSHLAKAVKATVTKPAVQIRRHEAVPAHIPPNCLKTFMGKNLSSDQTQNRQYDILRCVATGPIWWCLALGLPPRPFCIKLFDVV